MIDSLLQHGENLLKALNETNYMVFSSMFVTLVLSVIFGSLLYELGTKKTLTGRVFYQIVSILLNTLRSIPFLIFVFLLIPVMRGMLGTSFGNNAALVPLSLVGTSIYSRFVEQALILVPQRIKMRARSMGANMLQTHAYFLYPCAMSELVLSFTSVLISVLSYSSVMGIIGAGGLGEYAYRYGYQEYDRNLLYLMGIFFAIYVLLIQTAGYVISKIFR